MQWAARRSGGGSNPALIAADASGRKVRRTLALRCAVVGVISVLGVVARARFDLSKQDVTFGLFDVWRAIFSRKSPRTLTRGQELARERERERERFARIRYQRTQCDLSGR